MDDFERTKESIPWIAEPCMKPFLSRVEDAIAPGLTMLTWASMNIYKFIEDVKKALDDLKIFTKKVLLPG